MRTQATIRLIVCDSCSTREVIGDADDPMLGDNEVPDGWFAGTVLNPNFGDGEYVEWTACKAAHIKNAVLEVLKA